MCPLLSLIFIGRIIMSEDNTIESENKIVEPETEVEAEEVLSPRAAERKEVYGN